MAAVVIAGLVALLVAAVGLAVAGLLANRAPLLDPPGLGPRLRVYLTTNVAETAPDHPRPELVEPVFPVHPERLRAAVQEAFGALGWESGGAPPADGALRAVVTTPLWRFRDDVTVRVMPREGGGAGLAVRSASRVGRGDLGANTRHVLDLRREVARALGVGDGS